MAINDEMAQLLARARREISALIQEAATLPPDDAAEFMATLEHLAENAREIGRAIGH